MKLAIVVDSSCGLNKQEAEAKGWFYLPLVVEIDGKEYLDGIDFDYKTFFDKINVNSKVKTSITSPKYTIELFDKLQKEDYDKIIVYGLSKNLSSQVNHLKILAKEYKNIDVISSLGVASLIPFELEKIEREIKNNKISYDKAIEYLNREKSNFFLYLIPRNLDALVKGGRVNPTIAKLAKFLDIVPIIEFKNGGLEKYGKGRSYKKTIKKIVLKTYENLKDKNKMKNYKVFILQADNDEFNLIYNDILQILPNVDVESGYIPPVIAAHTGKGAIAVLFFEK